MPSNPESHSSIHSSNVPLSVKNQTKEKFDVLLKAAVQKKKKGDTREPNKSKQKLWNDLESTSASSENLIDKNKTDNIELNHLSEQRNENYILNKFLGHQIRQPQAAPTDIQNDKPKPPVPKPRKKKIVSPSESHATFEVTSPKVIKNLDNDGSSSSNKTYNVEPVGDILVHKSPLAPKIIVKDKTRKKLEKNYSKVFSDEEEHETSQQEDRITKSKNGDKTQKVDDECDESNNISGTEKNKADSKLTRQELDSKKVYTYERIVEIIIHKTDRLQMSSYVVHPVVKIHVVDLLTGKYLSKSDKNRPVVFFYENKETSYISPIMTHTYNLQEKRIMYPSWEESILLNEDFEYFKDECNHIILFFEILDFVSVTMLNQLHEKDYAKGWHNIAFAFLKLSGKNDLLNIDNKMRLQLYYSYQSKNNDPQTCNPWVWWKKKKLKKYSSTLYVTIRSIISPTKVIETFRSKTPMQRESSSKTKLCDEVQTAEQITGSGETVLINSANGSVSKAETVTWTRNRNEICKLPNKCLTKFDSYDEGCFIVKFSHNGLYLACGVQREILFYVVIYSVLSLREESKFPCHQGLIHSIKWSKDDLLLLSASADNTVSIFDLSSNLLFQILPHPTFVYSCDISHEKIIATGCYDGVVRIWNNKTQGMKTEYQLFQELEAHSGYVTSICFNNQLNIFSADSSGVIIEWQKENKDWMLKRKIVILDLRETIINQIVLFPKEKKMLVHSRDSTLRIIDLKSGCVLQWLRGALNKRFQILSCVSPCGTYVFSGSENGHIHVWNAKNGHKVATYTPFPTNHYFLTIHCIDFHPCDNIMAISHYGRHFPILLYIFAQSVERPEVDVAIQDTYSEGCSLKNDSQEPKLKTIVKKHYNLDNSQEKLDFKSILQKMDSVILSQKNC